MTETMFECCSAAYTRFFPLAALPHGDAIGLLRIEHTMVCGMDAKPVRKGSGAATFVRLDRTVHAALAAKACAPTKLASTDSACSP